MISIRLKRMPTFDAKRRSNQRCDNFALPFGQSSQGLWPCFSNHTSQVGLSC